MYNYYNFLLKNMGNSHSESQYPTSSEHPDAFNVDAGDASTTSAQVVDGTQFLFNEKLVQVNIGKSAEERLSSAQMETLLGVLKNRFNKANATRPKGVTFADVKEILEADPVRAYKVYVAEAHLGAEMDYTEYTDGENYFTDLRKETNVEQDVAFLCSIPAQERNAAIESLRKKYPKIPVDAFDRSPDDKNGPNKWEDKLIQAVTGLESISEADYRNIQGKLPKAQWLDVTGVSWLEEKSEKQLASGRAPRGDRGEGGVNVSESVAGYRSDIRGVRLRA